MLPRLGDECRILVLTMRLSGTDRGSAILSQRVVLIYERPSISTMPYAFKISNREPLQIQVDLNLKRMAAILITGPMYDDLHAGLSDVSRGTTTHENTLLA
jgi:hypothetical protein